MFPHPTLPPILRPFPIIVGDNNGGNTGSTVTVTTPAGSSGELLLLAVSVVSGSTRTVTAPSGFTEQYNVIPTGISSHRRAALFTKTADGTEGASITASISGTSEWGAVLLRVSGWNSLSLATGVNSVGTSDANPPSHSVSWGTLNTLWLAIVHGYDPIGTAPTNYTIVNTGSDGNAYMSIAERNNQVLTEDPGTFTGSNYWYATTCGISPS